ncbi:MAG: hypothetical protein CSB47_06640 [Proteobacteria bacterium]|nr:MAG: hypothetical protein CSB47_06640 [Pseudomonadota bacterium]
MNTKLKQEVISLLPWYHLGKLTDEEEALVDRALQEDPSLREALALEEAMIRAVREDKSLLDGSIFNSSADRLDNVLDKIAQLEREQPSKLTRRKEAKAKPGLLSHIKNYFEKLLAGSSHNFTYAVFAVLAVVQVALLALFIISSSDNGMYDLASFDEQDAKSASSSIVLLISMEGHFKANDFGEILGGRVDAALLPDNNNYYRVRISKHLSPQEIEELKHELSKRHGKVLFIGEESPL